MKTQALIIGGGVTGTGLARDLSMRGVDCVLVEKKDINAGASGANHGLLHSGARYISSDPMSAAECRRESDLLRRIAPHCIEDTGGLFVAVQGDDENYISDFPALCEKSGITTHPVDPAEARQMEPSLSDKLIAVYAVKDAAIDPFRLSLDNIAHARELGARLLRFSKVTSFSVSKGKITKVKVRDTRSGLETDVEADIVVNASGAWAGEVASMLGIDLRLLCSKGTLLVTQNRIAHKVINRLRKATDADILVPGGTVSILGTTSVRIETPDRIFPEIDEVDDIIREGADMIPELEYTRYIRAYCGVRPLFGVSDSGDDRSVSRGFALIDHADNGLENFITITGGKLTTYRLMAEKTADLVCERLGVSEPCRTHLEPLPSSIDAQWTEPGLAPHVWIRRNDPEDILLCECEMVPQSALDSVVESILRQGGKPGMKAIGLRSRIGKGPCQGTFCSQRILSYLYTKGKIERNEGLRDFKDFLCERWKGQLPMMWDIPLVQFELQEALHCGLFCLDLEEEK